MPSALRPFGIAVQSRIQGYMYNILSETDYRERLLPPTPPRKKEASPPIAARLPSSRRPIIDEAPPAHPHAAQAGQGAAYRTERLLVSSRAGDRSAVFRQGSSSQVASQKASQKPASCFMAAIPLRMTAD